uniref:Coat protein n=1 Tax=Yam virus 1 TaxID=3123105 RepID=A0AAU6NED2_9CLOS
MEDFPQEREGSKEPRRERDNFDDESGDMNYNTERSQGHQPIVRRDLISVEHMNPDKFSGIKVFSNRGDTLSVESMKTFKECMVNFCARILGAQPSEKQILAFFSSWVQSILNQSTSMKNANNYNLSNSFEVDGKTHIWKTADFINYVKGMIRDSPNPIRQYARAVEDEIEILKSAAIVKSDNHLQAKHGVLSPFWNATGDHVNGCLTNISDDDLAANYLMRCHALKQSSKESKVYNVSQLAPGGCK